MVKGCVATSCLRNIIKEWSCFAIQKIIHRNIFRTHWSGVDSISRFDRFSENTKSQNIIKRVMIHFCQANLPFLSHSICCLNFKPCLLLLFWQFRVQCPIIVLVMKIYNYESGNNLWLKE